MAGYPPMAALRLAGEPTELGAQHGAARRARIHAFLDDDLCRLNRLLPAPTDRIALRDTIDRHGESINEQLPRTFEEINGLAVGAGIDLRDALLLQLRREVAGYTAWPLPSGDCTTLCRFAQGDPVIAQTIDLNGDLDDHMEIVAIEHANGRRVHLVTFTGLLGYLGLNSDGLAIGINLVLGGTWAPGVPPYLALRHLLDECSDVDSCLDRLRGLRLASSRALTLCDRRQAVWVELVAGRMAVHRGEKLAHTNHFLAPDLAGYEGINPFALASSKRRLLAGQAAVAGLDPESIMSVLARPPIRVAANGDIRHDRTVGAVVLRPALGEVRVRRGDPALAPTEVFHIDDHARCP